MDPVILFNLVVLWIVVLLMLWLLLRMIEKQRTLVATRNIPASEPEPIEPLVGAPAPPFAAWTLDQQVVSHADYRDHETLFILLSTSCPHCHNVIPEIERVGEKLQRRGGKIALVFGEPVEQIRAYHDSLGLTLPVLVAPTKITTFTRDYNRRGRVPAFVAINSAGIVTHEGGINQREEAWRAFVREWRVFPLLTRATP